MVARMTTRTHFTFQFPRRYVDPSPEPCDVMRPFPAKLMRMWPISTRVNKPENDDRSIIEPIELATDAA